MAPSRATSCIAQTDRIRGSLEKDNALFPAFLGDMFFNRLFPVGVLFFLDYERRCSLDKAAVYGVGVGTKTDDPAKISSKVL